MNVIERKKKCKNHRPKYEEVKGGFVIYFCGECGWRGRFNIGTSGANG